MVTRKQSPQQPNHVVSVRLTAGTIKRLDALAERTDRSRGVNLRAAITRMPPTLEAEHWSPTSPRIREQLLPTGIYSAHCSTPR